MLSDIILVILAYFMGSVSFGLIIARLRGGVDLRGSGSGSIGATNVTRSMGKTAGVLTLLGDCMKGVIPVLLAQFWGKSTLMIALVALAAVLGHIFPWYARFQGGKGVATALGVLLPTLPLPLLGGLLIWIGVVATWRYVSAGSILAAVVIPLLAGVFSYPWPLVTAAGIIAFLVLVKHRTNVQRLMQGTEFKLFS